MSSASTPTQGERIATLEAEVKNMKDEFHGLKAVTEEGNKKLDDLLALRNKGIGAFALASSLIATGLLGWIGSLFGLFHHN